MEKVSNLPVGESKVKLILVTRYGEKLEIKPENGSWPIAVFQNEIQKMFCYPIFDGSAHRNLYGRLMTIVEAIIEDKDRQKAVKDLVSKELGSFSNDLNDSATEIAEDGGSSENIYTR